MVSLTLIVYFLIVAVPPTAKAQWTDVPDTAVNTADTAVNTDHTIVDTVGHLWDRLDWNMDHMDEAVNDAVASLRERVKALLGIRVANAIIGQGHISDHVRTEVPIVTGYSMAVPTDSLANHSGTNSFMAIGTATGNNLCNVSNGVAADRMMTDATELLLRSLIAMTTYASASGNRVNDAQQTLRDLCNYGFVSATQDQAIAGNQLPSGCGTNLNASFPMTEYYAADINTHTIFSHNEYDMPKKVQVQTPSGQPQTFVLPPLSQVNPTPSTSGSALGNSSQSMEMDWIAAYYMCKNYLPKINIPTSGQNASASTTGAADFLTVRTQALNATTANSSCLQTVAERTRVGQWALSPGATVPGPNAQGLTPPKTVLEFVYDAQVRECLTLRNAGEITDAVYQDCIVNGMSQLEARRNRACGLGSDEAMMIDSAISGKHDAYEVTHDTHEHKHDCAKFDAYQVDAQRDTIKALMQARDREMVATGNNR